jgi:hypothetical protein
MRRAVRFLQEKLKERMSNNRYSQFLFWCRRHIRIRLTDKVRSQQGLTTRGAEENNAIFYAGLTEAEILQFENKLRRILKNYEETERYGK